MERRRARRAPLARGVRAQEGGAAPPRPPSLKVATAEQKSVPLYGEFVGTLVGVKTVDIRARVEGFLAKREFVDGADVKEGQILFVIDQKPFLAALAQAVAQLARDEANHAQARAQLAQSVANLAKAEAQLAGDEANLSYAREQVERYRPLAAREFVTTEAFHQTETLARGAAATVESDKAAIKAAAAAAEAARAAVDQAAATIQADRAAITQAELNLSYTTMYAPMAGRIGRRQVDVGNLVGAGQSTLLATIVQLDPIYVYFAVPERDARNLLTQRPGGFPVTVTMAGRAAHPQSGHVDFVNNTVDATTGTFQVRATVANPERLLLPGQYAQVRLLLGTRPDAILVPEQAIVEEQGGQSVLVVGSGQEGPAPHGDGGPRIRGPAHHREGAQGRRGRARRGPAESPAGHAHRPEAMMTGR